MEKRDGREGQDGREKLDMREWREMETRSIPANSMFWTAVLVIFIIAGVARSTVRQTEAEAIPPQPSDQAKQMIDLPGNIMGESLHNWIRLLGKPKTHDVKSVINPYGKDSPPLYLHTLKWTGLEMQIQEVKGYRDFILEVKLNSPAKPFDLPVRWGMSPSQIKALFGSPQDELDDAMVHNLLHRTKIESEIVWVYGNVTDTYASGLLLIFDSQHLVSLVWQYGMD